MQLNIERTKKEMKKSISDLVIVNLPRKISAINNLQCLYTTLDFLLTFAFSLALKFVIKFKKSQIKFITIHTIKTKPQTHKGNVVTALINV